MSGQRTNVIATAQLIFDLTWTSLLLGIREYLMRVLPMILVPTTTILGPQKDWWNNFYGRQRASKWKTRTQVFSKSTCKQFGTILTVRFMLTVRKLGRHQSVRCAGLFWIYARKLLFVFIIMLKSKGSMDLSVCYKRNVFVWLPEFLPGSPATFICECRGVLNYNNMFILFSKLFIIEFIGYNNDLIAHCVWEVFKDYYLFTNWFRCDKHRANSPGCEKNLQGTDSVIMSQCLNMYSRCFQICTLSVIFAYQLTRTSICNNLCQFQ